MPTATPKPPVGRRTGRPAENRLGGIYSAIVDEAEDVPELRWPESVVAYDKIANSSQAAPLLRLLKQPIGDYNFQVDPGNANREAIAQAAHVLGIPMVGEDDSDRAKARRVEFIEYVLRATTLTHSVFELEGEKTAGGGWALRKLHLLSPRSLWRWQFVGNTAEVDWIEQNAPSGTLKLDRNRLAIMRYKAEPDYPYGQSILRPLYENWLRHKYFAGVSLAAGGRNGMGIPWVEIPEGTTPEDAAKMQEFAEQVAAGEDVGGSGPVGSMLHLVGVSGNTFDLLGHMRYEDESASKVLGGQILNLGTSQTGSRSVGDNHADLLWGARDAMARQSVCAPIASEILDRVAAWTGSDPEDLDGLPSVTCTRPTIVQPLTPEDWRALGEAGWLNPDDDGQRREFERRYNVPASERGTAAGVGGPPAAPSSVVAAARATKDTELVPGVPQARRPLNEIEETSRWPFAAMQTAWAAARDVLTRLWRRTRSDMITRATDAIAELERIEDHLDELHDITLKAARGAVTERVIEQSTAITTALAESSAAQAADAIAEQGLTAPLVDLEYAGHAKSDAKLVGNSLASSVSDQASRRAADLAEADAAKSKVKPDAPKGPGAPVAPKPKGAKPKGRSREIADDIKADLDTLTDAELERHAGRQATDAQNAGQSAQVDSVWPSADIASAYYSSLLDGATCSACAARDGHQYADMTEVRSDFPSGGYRACEGRDRCRCTWVFVLDSEMPVAVDDTRSGA